MKTKWLDRTLITSPYYIGLCFDEVSFHRELKRLKVPRKDWPSFTSTTHADATVHFLTCKSKRCAIVTIKRRKDIKLEQAYAMLVHEAVHIWQEIKEYIGERYPSSEFEAYSIQTIAQRLMLAYKGGNKNG